ncbi:hypothetical protein TNCV_4172791 [Trichonephila clavipes]|nr:hypothetical protein TNCV_4172791 [Trichonephila clavipes]
MEIDSTCMRLANPWSFYNAVERCHPSLAFRVVRLEVMRGVVCPFRSLRVALSRQQESLLRLVDEGILRTSLFGNRFRFLPNHDEENRKITSAILLNKSSRCQTEKVFSQRSVTCRGLSTGTRMRR